MKARIFLIACSSLLVLAACGQQGEETSASAEAENKAERVANTEAAEEAKLQIDVIKNGYGRAAVAGVLVTVHYTCV